MRYTLTVPTPPPPPISASSSGSGWPWWAWALLLAAVMAIAAASLLAPWNRWFGRVERWAFWRREWVRDRVRDHRGLVYLYAGLLAAVLVVWSLPSLLTRHPRVADAAARHTAITNTRTGLVATLAALGAGVGLAYTARTYRLSREGHLTDRYTKAVEQLGSDKIEVRLGGIYALERLMHDSPADRPTIIDGPRRVHPPPRPAWQPGTHRPGHDGTITFPSTADSRTAPVNPACPAGSAGRRRAGRAHRARPPHADRQRERNRPDRHASRRCLARRDGPV